MTTTYIVITTNPDDPFVEPEVYHLDTAEEIAEAQQALADAGIESAPVFVGEPGDPESYRNGQVLFAAN